MASTLTRLNIPTRARPVSAETPVYDIATLASEIAALQQTQNTILQVQNEQDTRLEELSVSVSSSTAPTYQNMIYLPPTAANGVPIDKLLMSSGILMLFISLSSTVVWLMGDVVLIHPAASVIGLLVSPCLYLMGLAARKQIAS